MYDGSVSNNYIVTDDYIGSAMDNAIILDAGVLSDGCFAKVGSNNRPGPDIRVFADFDVAHDVGSFADEC
jgi:hypothetical protein